MACERSFTVWIISFMQWWVLHKLQICKDNAIISFLIGRPVLGFQD